LLSRNRDNKGYVTNLAACLDGTPVTADPLPADLHEALGRIHGDPGAHY